MSDRFGDWVDHPALGAEERERLRRVHDLLLEVGPPPEPPMAAAPPEPGADVALLRRRRRPLLLLAATIALAAAGGSGYLLGRGEGERAATPTTPATTTVTTATATVTPPRQGPLVAMHGVGAAEGASATVEILPRAQSGDYPVQLRVEGLPANETFEMWVVDDDGELDARCGSFRTTAGVTETVLTAPYEMRTRDDWVIVRPGSTEPLLRT